MTGFIIPTNDRWLLGILNSKLIEFLMKLWAIYRRGGYLEYKVQYLQKIPIHKIDFENKKDKSHYDQMVAYVETMLELNKKLPKVKTEHEQTVIQRQIDSTDRKIDKLVYELYDLTEEEIKIVEENGK
jgi:hypothetical protein